MLVALLSVSAVLRSREEFLRLREKCTFTRTSGPGWSMLQRHGGYNASHDPVELKRTLQTTWCVQPDSELGAYLGVVRLDMGELAAGKRFVNPQLNSGDVVSFEPFWAAVKRSYGSPLPPSGHLTAGMMWPMLAGDDGSFTPLAYPPMHTHHIYALPESAGPSFVFSHADSYCAERDDHCLWYAAPLGAGLPFPTGVDFRVYVYLETLAKLSCPQLATPRGRVVLELAVQVVLGRQLRPVAMTDPTPSRYLPWGHPTDMYANLDVEPWAPHIVQDGGGEILQWQTISFPGKVKIVGQDPVDGHVKMHTHSAHTELILLVEGDAGSLGLNVPPFVRKLNHFKRPVPLLLGSMDRGGIGITKSQVMACLLRHLLNGASTAHSVAPLRDAKASCPLTAPIARPTARALCAWVGQSYAAPVGTCPSSAPLSEGFDRRSAMLTLPGGSCHPTLAARSPTTYLFFSRASKLGESLHHATFYPMHLLMERGHNQTSA